jgi:hypothetical protein
MLQEEILERNKEIALMLGWKEATLEYKMKWCAVPTEDRLNRLNQLYVPFLMKENNEPLFEDTVYWSKSWNSIMDAVEFINNLKIKQQTFYVSITRSNVWVYQYKNETNICPASASGVLPENEFKPLKETLFLAVSDFAKLYNNKKL